MRQPIPSFALPLLRGYDLRIDYRAEAEPPLAPEDAARADELLRGAGLR